MVHKSTYKCSLSVQIGIGVTIFKFSPKLLLKNFVNSDRFLLIILLKKVQTFDLGQVFNFKLCLSRMELENSAQVSLSA